MEEHLGSFFNVILVVYKVVTYFCKSILYLTTLIKLLIVSKICPVEFGILLIYGISYVNMKNVNNYFPI